MLNFCGRCNQIYYAKGYKVEREGIFKKRAGIEVGLGVVGDVGSGKSNKAP